MSGVSEREKQNDGVSEREKQKVKKMEIRRKVRSRSVNTILRSKSAKNTIFFSKVRSRPVKYDFAVKICQKYDFSSSSHSALYINET